MQNDHGIFQQMPSNDMQFIKIINGTPTPFYCRHLEGKAAPTDHRAMWLRDEKDAEKATLAAKQDTANGNN